MNLVSLFKQRLNTVEECRRLFMGCIVVHGMMDALFLMFDVKLLTFINIFSVTYYVIGMLLFPRINRSSVFTLMLSAEFIFNESSISSLTFMALLFHMNIQKYSL